MRLALMSLLILLSGVALAGAATQEPSGFPRDEASLRQLDNHQLRIVRRAGAQCWHVGQGGFGSKSAVSRACVMNGTEAMLASKKDPVLRAFSDALPMHVRYDENRASYYWQRWIIKR